MLSLVLAQPGFSWGPSHLNAHYLPYSVGCLWAKCLDNQTIVENVELLDMVAVREDIQHFVDKYDKIDVIGFSCYVWNYNYVNALAKAIKCKFPECVVVFGGPEPEHSDQDIFVNKPWLDCVVVQEGEVSFESILESLITNKSLETIPGLVINKQGQRIATPTAERITDLECLPSPYIKGVFDHLFSKHPDITWTAIIETNRGCPYKCTYCDWGSLTLSKIKKFLLDKIEQEIKWMSDKKIDFVNIADANYGIFKERDLAITRLFGKYRAATGWPKAVTTNWTKNAKQHVLDIAQEFKDQGIANSVTVSLQSLHDDVLDAVERKNFELNNIEDMSKSCFERQLPVAVDLILGLPMETSTSWKQTYYKLFDLDIHQDFYTHQAMLLENAHMNQNQLEQYGMEKFTRPIKFTEDNMQNTEYATFVKSTNTMTYDDMIDCAMHTNWIYALHHTGLSSEQSKFLHKHKGIPYSTFYNGLIECLLQHNFMHNCYQESVEQIKMAYSDIEEPTLEQIDLSLSGEFNILEWNIINKSIESDIQNCIKEFIYNQFDIDKDLVDQLDVYSRLSYLTYENHTKFDQLSHNFDYNFYEVNNLNAKMTKGKHTYAFKKKLSQTFENTVDYANYMIVRKRNIPSKNIITLQD
tara:strand:+ start:514 stop:2430 length:1917 start_codon:yes stop_codon:yes gene_type:complete